MKLFTFLFQFLLIFIVSNFVTAQQLINTDTIPGFDSKPNKLKISGVVYESDGITPAKNIIVSIDQADEHGNFNIIDDNGKSAVLNSGSIKTDDSGMYTFYTYIPGGDRRFNMQQQLFVFITESDNKSYEIPSFLFDEDPFLTKLCRKRITKKGDLGRILKPTNVDGLNVVQKDIVLPANAVALN
jgi:protocatechuate 3,4-dioxygenase beta subunit